MAFGGCVDDDAGENLDKLYKVKRILKGELKYAHEQLEKGPNTGTSGPYWEGFIDALEFVKKILK